MASAGWWGTIGVAGVLGLLAAGLPVLDSAIAGDQSLPAGTVLQVGQTKGRNGPREISFQAAPGWVLRRDDTDLSTNITVSKGATVFAISVVSLTPDPQTGRYPTARQLWKGLGRVVPLQWNAQLQPQTVAVTTQQGLTGRTGGLTSATHIGTASVFTAKDQGAEAVAAGPPDEFASVVDQVKAMVRSIRFRDFKGGSG